MKTVRDIPVLENIPVLVRAALNVPIGADGNVANPFRLTRAVPTIKYLQEKHARVVLIGHIGEKGTETLEPVYQALKQLVPNLSFCPATTGPEARAAIRDLSPGHAVMLENLRRDPGETGNDRAFATKLAELGDVFVEDSFDVCHREHASVVGVPKLLPSYAGLLVEEEMTELAKSLTPGHPALAIIGGAKFATKEPVLTKLLQTYDYVFVSGALANDFMKAAGHPVGASLVSGADPEQIAQLLQNPKLLLPKDYVVAAKGKSRADGRLAAIDDVHDDEAILDNGPQTIEMLANIIANAKAVLWNGPLGNYENGFVEATEALAKVIARSSAHSVIGGGDTVAAIEKLNLNDRFSFISTGGGAMLDFLAKGTLPGIEVLG
ncbi:MAG TPA: phosphoglycerate kinase [Candidatus Paceibacterota bacterium]|nr:phosphoglycerate kinase [Candidatus Paceibacterota bacterium]